MLNIDTSSTQEQRKFGLLMAAAIALLGSVRWALHGFYALPVYWWSVAALFLLLGLLAPRVLRPVLVYWLKLALVLNWIMTRVFLTLAFYAILLPTGLVMRLFAEDPLKRKWKAAGESYWEVPEDQPQTLERYRQQF